MELLKQAGRGDLDGVKTLIQQNVNVNTTNRCNQTALFHACDKGHTEVAQYLLDNGASVNLGAKPLIAAVRNDHYDCAKLLLQHHANVNCTNIKGESPMSISLEKRHYSIILLLLQYDAPFPSASLKDVATQLLQRAKAKDAKVIHKLIDRNLINLSSKDTFLAVFNYAFTRGSVELADKMLSCDTDSSSEIEEIFPDAAYYCAKNNWPTLLTKLMDKRFDINALSSGLQTPLYAACKEEHESIVTLLLNNGADPNVPNAASEDFSLPLQAVVQRGNAVLVKMLLDKGAKLEQPREPLLHTACCITAGVWNTDKAAGKKSIEHTLSIVKLLLQYGVDVNALSDKGDTALYRACTSQHGVPVVQFLLEAGADVNLTTNRRYPLIAACNAGSVELIPLLVKAGADLKCRNSNGETCLHLVIDAYSFITTDSKKPKDCLPNLDIVNVMKSLLESGVDVNASSLQEETALYRASKAGHEDVVKLLLEAGAKADGSSSRRPLHYACEHGYTQIVDLLLQYGADSNASGISHVRNVPMRYSELITKSHLDSSSSLPICCAAKKGYADIISLLIKHGADANRLDQSDKSALIYIVEQLSKQRSKTPQDPLSEERDINIMKSMLLAGGDINVLSRSDGLSALHIASSSGMCDVMTELIRRGANCNQLTSAGKTALRLACEKGHETAVQLLLESGAKADESTETTISRFGIYFSDKSYYQKPMPLLCTVAKNGSETMVKLFIEHGANVNACDKEGNTALHLTTSHVVTEILLNAGANVNATNDNGETALSVVCAKRQADAMVTELLLKFGADPNIRFPLHDACKNNVLDIVQLLLAHGADANAVKESLSQRLDVSSLWMARQLVAVVKNIEPSPLCIACKNGNVAMADCLLKSGAAVVFADSDGNTPLHSAIERIGEQAGLLEYDPLVTLLLQHGAPVNVVSKEGETPLYLACMKGLQGVVKQLLDCRAEVGLTTSNSNKYPLLIACERKFRTIAMKLLDRGANANVMKHKQTPLKLASANGDAVLVKELLSHGADVNQMQNVSDTALHVAVDRRKGPCNEAFVHILQKLLLKSNADPNVLNDKHETPLYVACSPTNAKVNLNIVEILLEHGADPNLCPHVVTSASWSSYGVDDDVLPPLLTAAECGNSELVTLLIKFGAKVDHITESGRTALHYAVGYDNRFTQRLESSSKSNYTPTAEILLSAGADANVMDKTGASPLYLACKRGKTEFVKLLLNHGAYPNTEVRNKFPIHAACNGQHYDSVKLLLEHNADVSAKDEDGRTALHHALEVYYSNKTGLPFLVQLLLDGGADVNAASNHGKTPFYIACSEGLVSIVVKMLEYGAEVEQYSGKYLPLHAACRNNRLAVVQLLLSNGANPNVPETPKDYGHCTLPLHIAAASGNGELVELLLKHGANVDNADDSGNTALQYSIEKYNPRAKTSQYSYKDRATSNPQSAVDILLENRADVNITNNSGETPLYKAASRQLVDVVRKMLQTYGGNPNIDSLQKNPLVVACERRNAELVETLLQHGADPNLSSKSCSRKSKFILPLCSAVKAGNCDAIIVLLLKAGASVNATNSEGKSALCIGTESILGCRSTFYIEHMKKELSTVRLLLEHGADVNVLMPDGRCLLNSTMTAIAEMQMRDARYGTHLTEFLQLLVNHGAILSDSCSMQESENTSRQLSATLKALATFDEKHGFIVELFKAGAGFQLIARCCNAVATSRSATRSISLCQAVVLAGYMPSAEELQDLQSTAAGDNVVGGLLDQLLNWLNEDRQKVPSLLRLSRIAIRRQLSFVAQYQTILSAIDKLPLPSTMKLYLQFEGSLTEVDLTGTISKELEIRETAEESLAENRHNFLSLYHALHYADYYYVSDFEDYFVYNSSDDEYNYYGSDSGNEW